MDMEEGNERDAQDSGGDLGRIGEQLAGEIQHFFKTKGPGKKADPAGGIVGCGLGSTAEHQNWDLGKAGVEFCDELRTADPGHMKSGDDETKVAGELRLFNEAESVGCIADALDIVETPFKKGFAQERLKWIVVHEQDCGHGVLNSARALDRPERNVDGLTPLL
jgi:hypothetical protein